MPGLRSNSRLGRAISIAVAVLAVIFFVLEETTDLPVPYGYDGDGFMLGAIVALVAIVVGGWQFRGFLSR